MANRTANATNATNWFQANGGNFRQVVIANPVANAAYRIYIRKSSSSPSAARTLSFVVTGLVENSYSVFTATVPVAVVNGTLNCADTTVLATNTTTCTAVPNALYRTLSIAGCGGTASTVGVNTYTTGAVTANCTVTATFELIPVLVNGACGTANGVATLSISPSTPNRCADSSSPLVITGATSFTWTCSGSNGGTNASCSAPRQYSVGLNANFGGSITCTSLAVTAGATTSCTATPNSGYVTSSISGCNGVATVSGINAYTTGAVTTTCTVAAVFALAAVAVEPALPVPTLAQWALVLLALSLALIGWVGTRRRA